MGVGSAGRLDRAVFCLMHNEDATASLAKGVRVSIYQISGAALYAAQLELLEGLLQHLHSRVSSTSFASCTPRLMATTAPGQPNGPGAGPVSTVHFSTCSSIIDRFESISVSTIDSASFTTPGT